MTAPDGAAAPDAAPAPHGASTPFLLSAFEMMTPVHQSPGLWRHPESRIAEFDRLAYWTRLARTVEDGGFSALFLADVLGLYDVYGGGIEATVRGGVQWPVLWCRTDLFGDAGLALPKTWDDYRAAAEKLTNPGRGMFGACFPAGRTWNTQIQATTTIWSAGGHLFDEKLNPTFDTPEVRRAMTYYAEMCRFSPPDSRVAMFLRTLVSPNWCSASSVRSHRSARVSARPSSRSFGSISRMARMFCSQVSLRKTLVSCVR